MAEMSRRSFLKTTAGAAAAVPVLAGGWQKLLAAESPGYFEREFGITRCPVPQGPGRGAGQGRRLSPTSTSSTPSATGSSWRTARSTGPTATWRWASASAPSRATRSATASPRSWTRRPMLKAAATAATIAAGSRRRPPATQFAWLQAGELLPARKRCCTAVPARSQAAPGAGRQRPLLRPFAAGGQGQRQLPRRAEAHPGRHQRRRQGRGPAAARLPHGLRDRREGRPQRAGGLEPRRPPGFLLLHARHVVEAIAAEGRRRRAACCSTPCSRRPARCRSCWARA